MRAFLYISYDPKVKTLSIIKNRLFMIVLQAEVRFNKVSSKNMFDLRECSAKPHDTTPHSPIRDLANQTSSNTLVQTRQPKWIGQSHLNSRLDCIHWVHGEDGNGSSNCCSCQMTTSFFNSRDKELQRSIRSDSNDLL